MKLKSVIDKVVERKLFEQMLLEANVANVKQPIGAKITIVGYLKQYAAGLGTPEMQAAFIKKLTSFLINDEHNLHALREVPADAPDWARTAAQQGQLMVFIPDEQLNDKIQHIIHYLAAAEQDSKQTANNDQRVFAQRELAGFAKAQSLDLLVKKSNEYFTRGTRSTKRQASGMSQVFDAGEGYIWYELDTAEAFQREGKLLQNCIGSHYTPAKCAREGLIIFVMRDPKDNTVVAARIKKEDNGYELQEVKGKQNKPPVSKYMEPTIKFLNKMKFAISSGAMYDLNNAGYFYIENVFYTLPEAIKKFLEAKEIAPLPSGGNVVRVTGNQEIMARAYPSSASSVVYEARSAAGDPEFSFYVRNFVLEQIRSSQVASEDETEEEQKATESQINPERRNEMFQVLSQKDLIADISNDIRKKFFWDENLRYNPKSKKFQKFEPSKKHVRPEGQRAWDQYSSPELISELHKIIMGDVQSHWGEKLNVTAREIKNIYLMHASMGRKFVLLQTKDGDVVPGIITNGTFRTNTEDFGFDSAYHKTKRFEKDVASLVSFANDHQLKIPQSIREAHGILETKGGYEIYQPQPKVIMQNPTVTLYSFENFKGSNRRVAYNYMADHFDLKNIGAHRYGENIFRDRFSGGGGPAADTVTALLKIDITYGVDKPHKFVLALEGKEITHIDRDTKKQQWQKWEDFDNIASAINKVQKELGLHYASSATKDAKEFKIVNGELSTKSHEIKKRLEKRKAKGTAGNEGVDALPYADGSVLEKMEPGEQAGWMRQGLSVSGIKGEVWRLIKPDGTIPYAYFVNNGKITRVLTHSRYYFTDMPLNKKVGVMPDERAYNQQALRYLKGAADIFGWKANMPTLMIEPKQTDRAFEELKELEHYGRRGKLKGYSDISREPIVQRLIRFKLVKRVHPEEDEDVFSNKYWVEITPAGVEALRKLEHGQPVDGLDHVRAEPIKAGFKLPEKSKEPLKTAAEQPRRARQPAAGGQTKAAMAMEKFREMQQANGGRIPTLSEFKAVLQQPPFDMSPLAAQTYYYATKKRLAGPIGEGIANLDFGELNFDLLHDIFEEVKVMRI